MWTVVDGQADDISTRRRAWRGPRARGDIEAGRLGINTTLVCTTNELDGGDGDMEEPPEPRARRRRVRRHLAWPADGIVS
jgi:hypothetical protein